MLNRLPFGVDLSQTKLQVMLSVLRPGNTKLELLLLEFINDEYQILRTGSDFYPISATLQSEFARLEIRRTTVRLIMFPSAKSEFKQQIAKRSHRKLPPGMSTSVMSVGDFSEHRKFRDLIQKRFITLQTGGFSSADWNREPSDEYSTSSGKRPVNRNTSSTSRL